MANIGGKRRFGERTFSHKPVVIEIAPSSAWTEDSYGHYLLVDLPEFKQEEVKLRVDNAGQITVSGERLVSDKTKIIRFEQTCKLPPDSDNDAISSKFDGEILYVTVPKRAVEETELAKSENEKENENVSGNGEIAEQINQETTLNKDDERGERGEDDHGGQSSDEKKEKNSQVDSFPEKGEKKAGQLEWAIKILWRNKGIVLTAVIAFSLGVYVTRKLGSVAGDERSAPFV